MKQLGVDQTISMRSLIAPGHYHWYEVRFRYSTTDPYAVRLVFTQDGITVEHHLDRSLLRLGLRTKVGAGLARVGPSGPDLNITLTNREGQRFFVAAPAADVEEFLHQTHRLVPHGAEGHLMEEILDDTLARLGVGA